MKSKKLPVITLKNITKVFRLRHAKPTFTDLFFTMPTKGQLFTALDEVSLTVFKGEKIGIFGSNGSGKTTLLKIIGGITTPTSGEVKVHGRVVSLIDLGAGFHQDLSGKENIYLNGTIIGMTKKEVDEVLESIILFADIGEFIYQPLYTYSEGMKLRLGFSIAIHSNPDIFLLDEGFGVGDESFRKKCDKVMNQLERSGKTIIIVSHWLDYLVEHTKELIILESGKVLKKGKSSLVSKYIRKTT